MELNSEVSKQTETYLFSRIGMALISAQRVEYAATEILMLLAESFPVYAGITTKEFLANTKKGIDHRITLGQTFRLLKLNPKLVLEEDFEEHLKQRNILVHSFWRTYMETKSMNQVKTADEFCKTFGKKAEKLESYFKGFIYFLGLRHVKDKYHLTDDIKRLEKDFEYFLLRTKENNS